jgi:hypothetical protein
MSGVHLEHPELLLSYCLKTLRVAQPFYPPRLLLDPKHIALSRPMIYICVAVRRFRIDFDFYVDESLDGNLGREYAELD